MCAYQGSYRFWNPGILLYLFEGLEMFWNLTIKQEVLEMFWKSMYLYECIFGFDGNTSHTVSTQGSFGLCYLTFKEAELINIIRMQQLIST